jgi:hypothetical protein
MNISAPGGALKHPGLAAQLISKTLEKLGRPAAGLASLPAPAVAGKGGRLDRVV